jgi:hypothetical protein
MAGDFELVKQLRSDNLFSRLAINLGLVTEQELDECLGVQFMNRDDKLQNVSDIMREKGYLTDDEVKQILDYQSARLIKCPQCGTDYNTILFKPASSFFCYNCAKELTVPVGPADNQ